MPGTAGSQEGEEMRNQTEESGAAWAGDAKFWWAAAGKKGRGRQVVRRQSSVVSLRGCQTKQAGDRPLWGD